MLWLPVVAAILICCAIGAWSPGQTAPAGCHDAGPAVAAG